ncbi:hypothetical protein LRAMOSA00502 [Lichtheimia ramosa]|uniref:Transcription regulator Rua1 C-terminal domain-containing protein n=1 Tax=Lichtheimia ramosa TaxID=688394 RepID=A0A077W8L9_9FUNG|nr:hypothetical protein LRAMOSA00502 [Lichtheimia ramosa]
MYYHHNIDQQDMQQQQHIWQDTAAPLWVNTSFPSNGTTATTPVQQALSTPLTAPSSSTDDSILFGPTITTVAATSKTSATMPISPPAYTTSSSVPSLSHPASSQVTNAGGPWYDFMSPEPLSFDDTLRDCINMLSSRKGSFDFAQFHQAQTKQEPLLTPAVSQHVDDNVIVASSLSEPLTTPAREQHYHHHSSVSPSPPSSHHHHSHHHDQQQQQQQMGYTQQQQQPDAVGILEHPPSLPYNHPSSNMPPTWLPEVQMDQDAMPRRQKPRYKDDEYSPKWVRYSGHLKEGYCDTCVEGRWLQLKNSAYWYHKQFYHGISSVSGKHFAEPLEQRLNAEGVIEGLCHQCETYVPICNSKRRRNNILWYKHAHKCHVYNKPEKYNNVSIY